MGCSRLTSWPSGSAGSSTVRITSTCPFPKMLSDRALEQPRRGVEDSGPLRQRGRAPHGDPEQDGASRVQQAAHQSGQYERNAEYVLVHFYNGPLAFQVCAADGGRGEGNMPNTVRIRAFPATLKTIATSADRRLDR